MVNVFIPQKRFQKVHLFIVLKPKLGLILIGKCKYDIKHPDLLINH